MGLTIAICVAALSTIVGLTFSIIGLVLGIKGNCYTGLGCALIGMVIVKSGFAIALVFA